MCLESGSKMLRRRPNPLPVLCFQDSSSDTDSEPPQALPRRLPARNSHPEIFTFDVESVAPAVKPLRAKGRRPRRVLYPAKVRRYLPAPETDRPLRWLYLLCLLVFVQICCEEAVPHELEELPSSGVQQQLLPQPCALQPVIPPVPLTNHSQLLHDATLSWVHHQR